MSETQITYCKCDEREGDNEECPYHAAKELPAFTVAGNPSESECAGVRE